MRFLFAILLFAFINICASANIEDSDGSKPKSLEVPVPTPDPCAGRRGGLMHEVLNAHPKQFPFMAAVFSRQNEYLCSGSLISNGIVLTTSKCIQQPVSYILLDATEATKAETTETLHVLKTEKFPTTGNEVSKDVGLIYTEKLNGSIANVIRVSKYTSAIKVSDVEAVGYGLNAETGQPKALQYVGVELRAMAPSEGDVLRAYFDCVDTRVPICFRDFGGPVILDEQLIGVVTNGQEDCTREMSAKYTNNKMIDMVPAHVFKSWLDGKMKESDEQENAVLLAAFPTRLLSGRRYLRQDDAAAAPAVTTTTAAPAAGDTFKPALKLILQALGVFLVIF